MLKTVFVVALLALVGAEMREPSYNKTEELASKSGAYIYMDCYDQAPPNNHDSIRIDRNIPSLYPEHWDNRITYCIATGIWLFYEDDEYNTRNPEKGSLWIWGNGEAVQFPPSFERQASSIRSAGSQYNWQNDETLTFYMNEDFIGDQEFLDCDKPRLNYDDQAKSAIITGCSSWTLYEEINWKGKCHCVGHGYKDSTRACDPIFLEHGQDLGIMDGKVSSVRKGCYCDY